MKLSIDTADNRLTRVALDGRSFTKTYASPQEQNLLAVIDALLHRARVKKDQITAIEVNTGPGAFTSLRVGRAVAYALGYALKVPVKERGLKSP